MNDLKIVTGNLYDLDERIQNVKRRWMLVPTIAIMTLTLAACNGEFGEVQIDTAQTSAGFGSIVIN
ncbi:MAG: hypothetical protein VYC65_03220, partial [Chloroflexota bacterium]|nr:hypothetical protein [Chloroflexota bacterium]